jgi:hypothetical protein
VHPVSLYPSLALSHTHTHSAVTAASLTLLAPGMTAPRHSPDTTFGRPCFRVPYKIYVWQLGMYKTVKSSNM